MFGDFGAVSLASYTWFGSIERKYITAESSTYSGITAAYNTYSFGRCFRERAQKWQRDDAIHLPAHH